MRGHVRLQTRRATRRRASLSSRPSKLFDDLRLQLDDSAALEGSNQPLVSFDMYGNAYTAGGEGLMTPATAVAGEAGVAPTEGASSSTDAAAAAAAGGGGGAPVAPGGAGGGGGGVGSFNPRRPCLAAASAGRSTRESPRSRASSPSRARRPAHWRRAGAARNRARRDAAAAPKAPVTAATARRRRSRPTARRRRRRRSTPAHGAGGARKRSRRGGEIASSEVVLRPKCGPQEHEIAQYLHVVS